MYEECACSCDYDFDLPEFFRTNRIKSAKVEHECCECEGKIERGQPYMKCVGKWEGEIDTFNICSSCCAIGTDLLGGCWSFGDMWNRIQECYGLEEEALPQSLIDYRKEWKARLKRTINV